MKHDAKSSVTLPREELALVKSLRKRLRAKSNVEVVRRGLYLLRDTTDREALKRAYQNAARDLRSVTVEELTELDHLSGEGLSDET